MNARFLQMLPSTPALGRGIQNPSRDNKKRKGKPGNRYFAEDPIELKKKGHKEVVRITLPTACPTPYHYQQAR